MASYLVRVGLDTGKIGGGGLAPIGPNGSFDYLPIPEDADTTETSTYNSISSRIGLIPSQYTSRTGDTTVHFDPEFETYTYGEVGTKKRRSLRKLSTDDLLVFYAGLQDPRGFEDARLYIIGYFRVDNVVDLEKLSPEERKSALERYPNNAHVKRNELTQGKTPPGRENYPVIVSGDPENSALLDKAVPLTSPYLSHTSNWYQKYRPLSTPLDILGLCTSDLTRSQPKKIRGDPQTIQSWLRGNYTIESQSRSPTPPHYTDSTAGSTPSTSEGSPKCRGYVLSTDSGFAPHVKNGLLSLATCAPMLRSAAKPGDWILAVGDDNYETWKELAYAFRVEYITTMDQYYQDERFHDRKPIPLNDNTSGDNIYAPRKVVSGIEEVAADALPDEAGAEEDHRYERGEVDGTLCYTHLDGEYFQLNPSYHDLANYKKDIEKQGDRENVLLSSDYYYFGDNTITLPTDLAQEIAPGLGEHDSRNASRKVSRPDRITDLVTWLRSNFRIGAHGEPKHSNRSIPSEETTGPGC